MEEHDQAYLYKRVVLPKHFLVFGKTQYNQYKYKIKAAFLPSGANVDHVRIEMGKPTGENFNGIEKI